MWFCLFFSTREDTTTRHSTREKGINTHQFHDHNVEAGKNHDPSQSDDGSKRELQAGTGQSISMKL